MHRAAPFVTTWRPDLTGCYYREMTSSTNSPERDSAENFDSSSTDATKPERRQIRVTPELYEELTKLAEAFGFTLNDVVLLAVRALKDRCSVNYSTDQAYLLREVQALELATQQLVLSNLSLAEVTYTLEASALRSLLQLSTLVRAHAGEAIVPTSP